MLIFKPFEFRKFLNGLCPCQIIPQPSAVANRTLAQLCVRRLTRQFHTFTLVSKTMNHCRVTATHLTRWLLPCKQSNTLLPETLAYTRNDKWTKNKVPKRNVNTNRNSTQNLFRCDRLEYWCITLAHFLSRNTRPFIKLNCPNISCLCLQPATFKWEEREKKPTTPEQNTEGSSLVSEQRGYCYVEESSKLESVQRSKHCSNRGDTQTQSAAHKR